MEAYYLIDLWDKILMIYCAASLEEAEHYLEPDETERVIRSVDYCPSQIPHSDSLTNEPYEAFITIQLQ